MRVSSAVLRLVAEVPAALVQVAPVEVELFDDVFVMPSTPMVHLDGLLKRSRAARVKGFSINFKADFAGGRLSQLPANVSGHYRLRSTYDRALTAQSVEARATRKTGC